MTPWYLGCVLRRLFPLMFLGACSSAPESLQNFSMEKPEGGSITFTGELGDKDESPTSAPGVVAASFLDGAGRELCLVSAPVEKSSYDEMGWFRVRASWPAGCEGAVVVERSFKTKGGKKLVFHHSKPPDWLGPSAPAKPLTAAKMGSMLWPSLLKTFRSIEAPAGEQPRCELAKLEAVNITPEGAPVMESVLRVDGEAMKRVASGQDTKKVFQFEDKMSRDSLQRVMFFNGYLLDKALAKPLPKEGTEALEDARRYLLVIWPTAWKWSVIVEKGTPDKIKNGRVIKKGRAGKSIPGTFSGVVSVVDRKSGRVVCWRRVSATSSAEVRIFNDNWTMQQIRDFDLVMNARKVADTAFSEMAPKLVAAAREAPAPAWIKFTSKISR